MEKVVSAVIKRSASFSDRLVSRLSDELVELFRISLEKMCSDGFGRVSCALDLGLRCCC